MRFIITTFINRAKETGTVPIVVFLPNWKDMVDHQSTGSTSYNNFYNEVKTSSYKHTYDGLEYFLPHLNKGEKVAAFFRSRLEGHYNPKGERILSAGFYKTLMSIEAKMGLLRQSD
jgi:hypothetical protein